MKLYKGGYCCIRDGQIFVQVSDSTLKPSNLTKEEIYLHIDTILEDGSIIPNINSIISAAVKKATVCEHFYHKKIPSENPNSKITYSDPLFIELENYIKGKESYKKNTKKRRDLHNARRKRAHDSYKEKMLNKSLDSFLFNERNKRYRKNK